MLYGDGHYYRKDRGDKVSFHIVGNKSGKALGKPPIGIDVESDRSATDKPFNPIMNPDGMALVKPNNSILNQDGKTALKAGGKEVKERIKMLEQQVKVERERREKLESLEVEKMAAVQQQVMAERDRSERLERELKEERERAKMEVERVTRQKEELEKKAKEEEEDGKMDEDGEETDVFEMDEEMIQAGPYFNVRAARMYSMESEIVLGDLRGHKRKEAGFNLKGESRLEKVVWRHRLDVGQNITASFNAANMKCTGCPGRGVHSVVGRDDGKPVVIVASDQNFHPVLYSDNADACIGILRIEYGTVKELGFAVADMLHGVSLPPGSVILVGWPSDLGRQGIVGYTDELARTLRILKEKQGGMVKVVALPPVLLGGINSFTVLRLVVEAEHWAERLEGGDGILLKKTRCEVVKKIGEHALGYVKDPEVRVDTLLKKVDGYERVRVWSAVWRNMPERMLPLSEEGERMIVETLVDELRTNFGVRVSSQLGMLREGGKVQPTFKYVVIGASNADRVGDILKASGKDVIKVTKGGWRPSKAGVAEMVGKMVGLDLEGRIAIIYGMDNGVYYEEDEDGDRALPKADEKGKYHVVGKVELATQKQAKSLFGNCEPILDKLQDNRKMIVTPGVRFFRERCCENPAHCVNVCENGYRRGVLEDLARIKDAVGDICRETSMKGYKVVSPVELLGIRVTMEENELVQILGDNPVHLSGTGYQRLAGSLINMAENPRTIFAGEKRMWEDEGEEDGMENYHRKRHDWLYNVVSGARGVKNGQVVRMGGQERGREAGKGAGHVRTPGQGQQYQNPGDRGGNGFPYQQ